MGTVKCGLQRFRPHPDLLASIERAATAISYFSHYASHMLLGFTLWAFETDQPYLPDLQPHALESLITVMMQRNDVADKTDFLHEGQRSFQRYYSEAWKQLPRCEARKL